MLPPRRRTEKSPARVLLVGWDAADWQMIQPLIARGLMPTTAALMERGSWGNIATTRPILSPMLWNTIATGKRPQQHGVYGFTEPNADGTGVQPVASTSRKCKALWNILTQCGLRSNVVGWYASHPAEPIDGVMVSNQFEQFTVDRRAVSPVTAGSIHPPEMADELAPFRVLPARDRRDGDPAVRPERGRDCLEQENHRLGKLQHMLAQTATIHAVATHLMANTEWDFTAVYYEGIDRFGHEFMEFHPPKMEQVSQEDFDAYQHCMVGIYRFHDMLLETLLDARRRRHGGHLDVGPRLLQRPPATRSARGQSRGPSTGIGRSAFSPAADPAFAPGAASTARAFSTSPRRCCNLLGLPAAHDMPGRVLAEVLDDATTARSHRVVGRNRRRLRHARRRTADRSRRIAGRDAAVGGARLRRSAQRRRREVDSPDRQLQSATCSRSRWSTHTNSPRRSTVFDELDDEVRDERLPIQLHGHLLPRTATTAASARRDPRGAADSAACDAPRMHMMLGALEFADGNPAAALEHLQQVAAAEPRLPYLHNKLGEVYLETKRYALAIAAFEKALEIDGESPVAFAGLARARLETGDPQGRSTWP